MAGFELLGPGKHLPADYWTSFSGGLATVEVELGVGDGRFLANSAKARPRTFFVGFEVRAAAAREAATAAAQAPNAWIHHGDGRWIVCHLFAPETIDAFHVYFPDPWWKKRHHKRRMFSSELCAALYRTLKPGGSVYVITDVAAQFADIARRLRDRGFFTTDWAREPDDPAQSSYERKYRRQGRKLYSARFEKRAQV